MTPPIQPQGVAAQQVAEVAGGEEVGVVNEEAAPVLPEQEEDPLSDNPSDPSSDSDNMARKKSACSIPIEKFQTGTDDYDEWSRRFEVAVKLATNPQTPNRENELMLQWLTLSLDPAALAIKEQVPANAPYTTTNNVKGVKQHLQELLVDPHEVYKWQAMKTQIKWDEKESFQELATRVKRAVDKFDKSLDADNKEKAYFFRFREALPKIYKDAIDINCEEHERTIHNAKKLALRIQMTRPEEAAALTGAAMEDDRIHTVELKVEELGTKLNNMSFANKERKSSKERFDASKAKKRETSSSGDREEFRKFKEWRDRERNRDRDRDRDRDRRGRRDSTRGRDSSRDSSRDDDRRNRNSGGRRRDNRRDRDRRSGRKDRDNRRNRDRDRRESPSTSRSGGSRSDDDRRKDRGKKVSFKDKNEYNSLKTEDETSAVSSGSETEEDTKHKKASSRSKRKGKSEK